jgi:fluoride exporter
MNGFLLVGLGGAVGAMLRHGASLYALRTFGPGYPWGTLLVNVSGGLLMGFLVGYLAFQGSGARDLRLLLATGVLGGFTTFSAFSLEAALMIERKAWGQAIGYAGLSVGLCVLAVFAGLMLARKVFA